MDLLRDLPSIGLGYEIAGGSIEEFIKLPEALEQFERGLDRYLARNGNLKIPAFYIDEDGVPIGSLYALACHYWITGEAVDPFFPNINRKFFVKNLWPQWDAFNSAQADRIFSPTPSLTGIFESHDGLNGAVAGFFDTVLNEHLWHPEDPLRVEKAWNIEKNTLEGALSELAQSLNVKDPLSLRAFLTDFWMAERLCGQRLFSLADCVIDLMWTLAEVSDGKKVISFDPSNTQVMDRYFAIQDRNNRGEIDPQPRIELETVFNADSQSQFFADLKQLIYEKLNIFEKHSVGGTDLELYVIDEKADSIIAIIPPGAKVEIDDVIRKKKAVRKGDEKGSPNIKSTGNAKKRRCAVEPIAIRNIANSLANNGRAIVVVSDRVLFSEVSEFSELRRFLIDEYCVEEIIALRASSNRRFSVHTSSNLNLLVFSKKAPTSRVRFTVLKGVGVGQLDQKTLQDEQLDSSWLKQLVLNAHDLEHEQPRLSGNFYQRESEVPLAQRLQFEDAWTETLEELREKNLNLLPRNLKSSEWMQLIEKFQKQDDIAILKLGDLFDVVSPKSLPSRKLEEITTGEGTPVLEANRFKESQYRFDQTLPPKRKVQLPDDFPESQRLRVGDIAISTKGTLGKFVVIARFANQEYIGAVPGSTITILRPKELSEDQPGFHESWLGDGAEIKGGEPQKKSDVRKRKLAGITETDLPEYVSAFFQTDAFQDWLSLMSQGTGIQTLTTKDLREFLVPVTLNKQRANDIQRVYAYKTNSFAENQTELESILLGRYQPFERFIESDTVKKFLEFFHEVRALKGDSLAKTLAGPFYSGSSLYGRGDAKKATKNPDPRDLLEEFRPLVESVFTLGSETATVFYRAQSKSKSRREETALMRTFDSFTFRPGAILACNDAGLQFGLWQQALNEIYGLEAYFWSSETQELLSAAKKEKPGEWVLSESATVLLGITTYFEAEIKRALQDIDFEVGLVSQPEISESQQELEIQVYFKNKSRLPLCGVTVKAGRDNEDSESVRHPCFEEWGQHQSYWLYPGETHQFSVIIPEGESQVLRLTDEEIENRKRFDEFVKGFDLKELPSLEEKLRNKGSDSEEIESIVSMVRERKNAHETIEKLEKFRLEIDRMKRLQEASDTNGVDVDDSSVANYFEEKAQEGLSQIVKNEKADDPRKIELIFAITGLTLSGNFMITASVWEGDIWASRHTENALYREDKRLRVTVTPKADIQKTTISQDSVNPYIVGNPIDRKDMLFGRDHVLSDIKQQLGTSGTQSNPVLIEGNRRTGKTSILHELQRSISTEEMIPVYVSLQSGEGSKDGRPGLDTAEVFRLIARQIGFAVEESGVEVELPGESLTDPEKNFKFQFARKLQNVFNNERPFDTLRLYVEQVLDSIAPRKVLLMLDEFDHIHVGTRSGVTNPQVPDNIRSLVHEHKNLALIISGTKELKKIRDDYWSTLFGFAYTIPVSSLSEDAAGELVQEPAKGQLKYRTRAVEEIVRLCGSQPFLIQTLCSRIFSGAMETQNSDVGNAQVEAAAERMAKDNEHFRNLFYREISSDLQRIIFMMILKRFEADGTRLNRGDLETALYQGRVPYSEEKLDDEIDHLVDLEIIKEHKFSSGEIGGYEPLVPLFGIWIKQNVEYDELVKALEDQVS